MRARITAAAVLVCALSACTSAREKMPEQPDVAPAPEAMASAVDAFIESNTGRYKFFMGEEDSFVLASDGDYVLDEEISHLDTVMRGDGKELNVETILLKDSMWSRHAMSPQTPTGCWLRADLNGTKGAVAGDPTANASAEGSVAQLVVVEQAEGVKWESEGTVLTATTDLFPLVLTLGKTWSQLDFGPTSKHRTEVTFLLEHGEIVAWRTDLAAILEAVRDAGVKITPEMEQLVESEVKIPVTTNFDELGSDVEIRRPEKESYVNVSTDNNAIQRDMATCNSRNS